MSPMSSTQTNLHQSLCRSTSAVTNELSGRCGVQLLQRKKIMSESVLDLLFNPSKNQRPRRTLVYGVEGIGKSTIASQWPGVVFLPTEDGLRNIDCQSFHSPKSFKEMMDTLRAVAKLPSIPFGTLAIDTADGVANLIDHDVKESHNEKELSFGKDQLLCADKWRELLNALEWFNTSKQIGIVLLGHSHVEKFADPSGDSYDRFAPRLPKHSSAIVREWCDEVLFATYKVFRTETDEGFNRKRTIGVDGGRVLKTCEKPSHLAKNRLRLPDEIELSYATLSAYYPKAGDIAGMIKDGSSKKKNEQPAAAAS